MRLIVRLLFFVPALVLGLVFAISNRHPVLLVLNPFGDGAEKSALSMPLFLCVFLALILGLLLGGVFVWFSQARYRRAMRLAQEEMAYLRSQHQQYRELSS